MSMIGVLLTLQILRRKCQPSAPYVRFQRHAGHIAEEANKTICSNASDTGSRIEINLCAQVCLNIFNSCIQLL